MLAERFPEHTIALISEPLLRDYERRHGMTANALDEYDAKAAARPGLAALAEQLLAADPDWLIDRALRHPRPLIVVGPRCSADLHRLVDLGAVFVEVDADPHVRRARIGAEGFPSADEDPFDKELAAFATVRLRVDNNGTLEALRSQVDQVAGLIEPESGLPAEAFADVAQLMDRLLDPLEGCPWNREQSLTSVLPYLLEETYEVLDAVDQDDVDGHCDELGDLLFQILFHAALRARQGAFDLGDVCRALIGKMTRRHPHVFGGVAVDGVEEVLANWESIKRQEQAESGRERRPLDGVPRALPALLLAQRTLERAADRPDFTSASAALRAAVDAVEAAPGGEPELKEHLLGELLLTVVRIGTVVGVAPEDALRRRLLESKRASQLVRSDSEVDHD
ncbi:MazG family protein [Amycolatopsis orientalis]